MQTFRAILEIPHFPNLPTKHGPQFENCDTFKVTGVGGEGGSCTDNSFILANTTNDTSIKIIKAKQLTIL